MISESGKKLYDEYEAVALAEGFAPARASLIAYAGVKDFKEYSREEVFPVADAVVTRSEGGKVFFKQPLATTRKINGLSLSQVALKRLASQINAEKVKGRIDVSHKALQLLSGDDLDDLEVKLAGLGDLEAVSAEVVNDVLVATIMADEAVFAKANGFRGASIEARIPSVSIRGGVSDQARLVSFVLTDKPADPEAVRQ